jgi:hypothetical protein
MIGMSYEKGSALKMLDLTLEEYDELYYTNQKLFRSVDNWFYFANDEKPSPLASKGYVRYGRNRARKKSLGFTKDDYGGAVLLCETEDMDIDSICKKCALEKENIVPFQLKDGTDAHYGVMNDSIGAFGPRGADRVLIIIPNKPQKKIWPFSMNGNARFDMASMEEGTLPYDVRTGKIEELLPDRVKEDLKIV